MALHAPAPALSPAKPSRRRVHLITSPTQTDASAGVLGSSVFVEITKAGAKFLLALTFNDEGIVSAADLYKKD